MKMKKSTLSSSLPLLNCNISSNDDNSNTNTTTSRNGSGNSDSNSVSTECCELLLNLNDSLIKNESYDHNDNNNDNENNQAMNDGNDNNYLLLFSTTTNDSHIVSSTNAPINTSDDDDDKKNILANQHLHNQKLEAEEKEEEEEERNFLEFNASNALDNKNSSFNSRISVKQRKQMLLENNNKSALDSLTSSSSSALSSLPRIADTFAAAGVVTVNLKQQQQQHNLKLDNDCLLKAHNHESNRNDKKETNDNKNIHNINEAKEKIAAAQTTKTMNKWKFYDLVSSPVLATTRTKASSNVMNKNNQLQATNGHDPVRVIKITEIIEINGEKKKKPTPVVDEKPTTTTTTTSSTTHMTTHRTQHLSNRPTVEPAVVRSRQIVKSSTSCRQVEEQKFAQDTISRYEETSSENYNYSSSSSSSKSAPNYPIIPKPVRVLTSSKKQPVIVSEKSPPRESHLTTAYRQLPILIEKTSQTSPTKATHDEEEDEDEERSHTFTKPAEIVLEIINICENEPEAASSNNRDDVTTKQPKKITIKITGKTRSFSSDGASTKKTTSEEKTPKTMQQTVTFADSPKVSFAPAQTKKGLLKKSPSIEVNNKKFDLFKPIDKNDEPTAESPSVSKLNQFDFNKFKSYLNAFNQQTSSSSASRSYSMPPKISNLNLPLRGGKKSDLTSCTISEDDDQSTSNPVVNEPTPDDESDTNRLCLEAKKVVETKEVVKHRQKIVPTSSTGYMEPDLFDFNSITEYDPYAFTVKNKLNSSSQKRRTAFNSRKSTAVVSDDYNSAANSSISTTTGNNNTSRRLVCSDNEEPIWTYRTSTTTSSTTKTTKAHDDSARQIANLYKTYGNQMDLSSAAQKSKKKPLLSKQSSLNSGHHTFSCGLFNKSAKQQAENDADEAFLYDFEHLKKRSERPVLASNSSSSFYASKSNNKQPVANSPVTSLGLSKIDELKAYNKTDSPKAKTTEKKAISAYYNKFYYDRKRLIGGNAADESYDDETEENPDTNDDELDEHDSNNDEEDEDDENPEANEEDDDGSENDAEEIENLIDVNFNNATLKKHLSHKESANFDDDDQHMSESNNENKNNRNNNNNNRQNKQTTQAPVTKTNVKLGHFLTFLPVKEDETSAAGSNTKANSLLNSPRTPKLIRKVLFSDQY